MTIEGQAMKPSSLIHPDAAHLPLAKWRVHVPLKLPAGEQVIHRDEHLRLYIRSLRSRLVVAVVCDVSDVADSDAPCRLVKTSFIFVCEMDDPTS